jgi:hypothetical protein
MPRSAPRSTRSPDGRVDAAGAAPGCSPEQAAQARRRFVVAASGHWNRVNRRLAAIVPLCALLSLVGCGSDKKTPQTVPPVETTIGGQQAPNAGGNNNSGNSPNGPSSNAPAVSTPGDGSTGATVEQIGDQTPGQGSSTP